MLKALTTNVLAVLFVVLGLSPLAQADFYYNKYNGGGSSRSSGNGGFPIKPDPSVTPGALCQYANRLRYPEHIKYCERDVDPQTKWQVINVYVQRFGYNINSGNRMSFKIDHYIPLCMGGSNEVANLWPQHESVYKQTDPMEPLLCEKMSMGRLKQAEAIQLIKKGKNDFSQIRGIINYVNGL